MPADRSRTAAYAIRDLISAAGYAAGGRSFADAAGRSDRSPAAAVVLSHGQIAAAGCVVELAGSAMPVAAEPVGLLAGGGRSSRSSSADDGLPAAGELAAADAAGRDQVFAELCQTVDGDLGSAVAYLGSAVFDLEFEVVCLESEVVSLEPVDVRRTFAVEAVSPGSVAVDGPGGLGPLVDAVPEVVARPDYLRVFRRLLHDHVPGQISRFRGQERRREPGRSRPSNLLDIFFAYFPPIEDTSVLLYKKAICVPTTDFQQLSGAEAGKADILSFSSNHLVRAVSDIGARFPYIN